jgi:uncharacterized protein YqjF (DUF2071 family)
MQLPTSQIDHRAYAPPPGPPAMCMTWNELAFLHWPVDPAALARRLPPGLVLDTFGGSAYLGVVPFEMARTRFRLAPPIPTATRFPELNVRTYVTHGGRPGVWFFSLDAASKLAVRGARAAFHLPYFDAHMAFARESEWLGYASTRTHRGAPPAHFAGRYRATGPQISARPGTLEHFLTERYCLYAHGRRRLLRGEIHHAPWPLRPGEVELEVCDMTRLVGFELAGAPPLVHVVDSLDVVSWWPVKVQ